jgi:hypothetical protein
VPRNDEAPDEESVDGQLPGCEVPDSEPEPVLRTQSPASPLHCAVHRSTATPSPTPTPHRARWADRMPDRQPSPARRHTDASGSGLPRPVINPPAKEAPPTGIAVRGSLRRRLKSAPATPVSALAGARAEAAGGSPHATSGSCTPTARSSYEAYEERALPALRK